MAICPYYAFELVKKPTRKKKCPNCVELIRDVAGAVTAMLASLSEDKKQEAWDEMEQALKKFEGPQGFKAPSESIVGAGMKA